ncbi:MULTISPECIES: leucine-rich repeat domain-containing protein [Leucobacter]|uniref:leucine-rich repeat domain-containing protein n=1 Tax=Leucobacter TaxID=55968 RepID=UPI00069B0C59|nr:MULTISPECIES: leucine-rich repeat domain-containing protein [Leucobacter]
MRDALDIADPAPVTEGDMATVTSLICEGLEIVDISPLAYATGLTDLYLGENQIADVTPLASVTNLLVLQLGTNQVTDIGPLEGLTDLQWVELDHNQISDLGPLTELTNLDYLDVSSNAIIDLGPLSSLTALDSLDVSDNQISAISPLADLTSLTSLGLSHKQIADVSPLEELTGLTALTLDNNQIADIDPLAGLTDLVGLDLSTNQIVSVTQLAGLEDLEQLDLDYNQISDTTPLAGLTNLEDLHLDGNQVSDLYPLAGLSSLDFATAWDQHPARSAVVNVPQAIAVINSNQALVPVWVVGGVGILSGTDVTWTEPGTWNLAWSETISLPSGGISMFSGTAAYTVVPFAEIPAITGTPGNGVVGTPYNFAFAVTGTPSPEVTITDGKLPDGLTLSNDDVTSGTPTQVGTFIFTVTATNSEGEATLTDQSITVASAETGATAPTIAGKPGAGVVGASYDYAFTVTGNPVPTVKVTAGALPDGLSLSSTGRIKGTPTQAGTFIFTVTATNSEGEATLTNRSMAVSNADAKNPESNLPTTGGEAFWSLGGAALLMLLAGASLVLVHARRSRHAS